MLKKLRGRSVISLSCSHLTIRESASSKSTIVFTLHCSITRTISWCNSLLPFPFVNKSLPLIPIISNPCIEPLNALNSPSAKNKNFISSFLATFSIILGGKKGTKPEPLVWVYFWSFLGILRRVRKNVFSGLSFVFAV